MPGQVTGLKVDAIIRGGIRRFTDEVGRLWTSLADFYIRKGLFERARDVYEEGMASVLTVRDFSLVFDAYSQFEESVLATKMEAQVPLTPPALVSSCLSSQHTLLPSFEGVNIIPLHPLSFRSTSWISDCHSWTLHLP